MKLQSLRGYGPAASFVSAIALVAIVALQQSTLFLTSLFIAMPSLVNLVVAAFVIALFTWAAALSVALFDLEYIEHPRTSSGWLRAALVASLVATAMPALLALAQYAGVPIPATAIFAVMYGGFGFSLLVYNIEGRRAGLLRGALPWLGIVTGACFVYLTGPFAYGPKALMFWLYGEPIAQTLCIVWAVWLGLKMSRSLQAVTASA